MAGPRSPHFTVEAKAATWTIPAASEAWQAGAGVQFLGRSFLALMLEQAAPWLVEERVLMRHHARSVSSSLCSDSSSWSGKYV